MLPKDRPGFESMCSALPYPGRTLRRRQIRSLTIMIAAAGVICTSVKPAKADCNLAISSYNSALSDIENYLRRYTRCLNSSDGADDCSSEFRRLRSAQSDFESAVSEYQLYCRR